MTVVTLLLNYPSTVSATTTPLPYINNALSIARSYPLEDTLIVPGKRVGPITGETTYQNLARLYGSGKLTSKKFYTAEGETELAATQVNLASKSFTIVWEDASKSKPFFVTGLGPAWKTNEGIGVGTSFAQLSKLCGEFQVSGLYWDYGNTISFKKDSSCSNSLRGLTLSVDASPQAKKKFARDLNAVMGDQTLSSTNPHWRHLEMRVIDMNVYLSTSHT